MEDPHNLQRQIRLEGVIKNLKPSPPPSPPPRNCTLGSGAESGMWTSPDICFPQISKQSGREMEMVINAVMLLHLECANPIDSPHHGGCRAYGDRWRAPRLPTPSLLSPSSLGPRAGRPEIPQGRARAAGSKELLKQSSGLPALGPWRTGRVLCLCLDSRASHPPPSVITAALALAGPPRGSEVQPGPEAPRRAWVLLLRAAGDRGLEAEGTPKLSAAGRPECGGRVFPLPSVPGPSAAGCLAEFFWSFFPSSHRKHWSYMNCFSYGPERKSLEKATARQSKATSPLCSKEETWGLLSASVRPGHPLPSSTQTQCLGFWGELGRLPSSGIRAKGCRIRGGSQGMSPTRGPSRFRREQLAHPTPEAGQEPEDDGSAGPRARGWARKGVARPPLPWLQARS